MIDDGAKRYVRSYGGDVRDDFPKRQRKDLAKDYVEKFEGVFKNQEFDFMRQENRMLKLKKLIKEHTWDREFGDPLPTFEDVMGKHQVNKLKEDWWDDMSPEDQASYIKDHPGSKLAQDAGGDEPEKITKGPGGYGDRGNVRGQDQAYSGEPDDEEYFK